jgi:flagellar biosynthesis protein FlhA
MRLDPHEYRIKIADTPVATDRVEPSLLLAIDSGLTSSQIDGIPTKDPAFGADAKWITVGNKDAAEMYGYTVVEPGAVIATHMTEVCRRHADEILTRDAAKHLVDELKQTHPAVVGELIPGVMSLAEVQAVLHLLLREQVPVRQLSVILETLGDYAPRTKDPILLTEYVRHRLARQICTRYRNANGQLHAIAVDPALEDRIRAGFEHNERGLFIRMSPQAMSDVPGDRHPVAQAHQRRPRADCAGQPADPRRAQTTHRKPFAKSRRPQLQRNHARHAGRHTRTRRRCLIRETKKKKSSTEERGLSSLSRIGH